MPRKKNEMPRTKERLHFWWSGIRQELSSWSSAQQRTVKLLKQVENGIPDDIQARLDYYVKRSSPFAYNAQIYLGSLSWGYREMYYIDLMRVAKGFGKRFRINTEFEVVVEIPPIATVLRTRPLTGNHDNSILFPLNRFRHFYFPEDPVAWDQKIPFMAWRGRANGQPPRIELLKRYHDHAEHNIGHRVKTDSYPGYKDFMSVQDHMKYRYIPAFEGFNEATSLKWIMNSGSVPVCHPMRYEGWFMEGRLEADVHYIETRHDLKDLDEKLDWYNRHPEQAQAIVKNANAWTKQFQNQECEDLIATLVLLRYAKLTRNNIPKALTPYLDLV
ncbi:MAG: glycosyl transferase family 90 [Reinekea sp.]